MTVPNWDEQSKLGLLQAVIDPKDKLGFKNALIDRLQWGSLKKSLQGIKRVLDFGCGTGRYYSRITNMGIEYSGMDTSAGMIEMARRLNPSGEKRFQVFDGRRIPFPDEYFDAVFSCGVLIYVVGSPNSEMVSDEVKRVLKPGGFFIMVEQATCSNKMSELAVRPLTEKDYRDFLSKGFEVKKIERVRSRSFSGLTHKVLDLAGFFHWFPNPVAAAVAAMEERKIRNCNDAYLSKIDYYDVLIHSVRK